MIRKVCPICEQTMSLPHYCKNCRQFVKSPYVRDITYYLNESHPEGEKDCDYHNVHRGRESRNAKDMGRRAGRTIREHTGTGRKRIWLAFLGIYVAIQLIGAVGSVVAKRYVQADRDVDEDESFRRLSDEEVQEEGTPCNSNGHYSVTGEEMAREILRIIDNGGYEIDSVDTSSWNYEDIVGDELWTDYEISIDHYMYRKDSGFKDLDPDLLLDSMTVNYDTATGELHGVSMYMTEVGSGAFMAGRIVEFLQEQEEIPGDQAYGELVEGEIRSCSDRGEDEEESGGWMEIPDEGDDRTEVYFHETDGGIYVRVWKGRE